MASNALNVPDAASVVSSTTTGNDSDDENKTAMGYQQTLMYGSYSKTLGKQIYLSLCKCPFQIGAKFCLVPWHETWKIDPN